MGSALYTSKGTAEVCHGTMEACKSMCPTDCIFVSSCNGKENQYACVVFDSRMLMWLIFICFLITVCCCASLVACYFCKAIRHSSRHARRTENDIVFTNPGRVHHVQYSAPTRYSHGPSHKY
ncbi:unnamed protein product, partial [Mesorhabditis belari]|uniref:Uncharacterized protein n=1 Tax=Mesorhabditis belari TaxID=2138241 RepID=A0AAF3FN52_9BILA